MAPLTIDENVTMLPHRDLSAAATGARRIGAFLRSTTRGKVSAGRVVEYIWGRSCGPLVFRLPDMEELFSVE
ncbi:hypothetical protein MRX96_024978 [Rhipicephalus microplus]